MALFDACSAVSATTPLAATPDDVALDALFFSRVRPSGLPLGLVGWRPPEVRPSPPPCGWSTGFMTTPRTVGRLPFQRFRPALPMLMMSCSELPTAPRTRGRSPAPGGSRRRAAAARPCCPPWPAAGSGCPRCGRAWRRRRGAAPPRAPRCRRGCCAAGSALPGLMSAPRRTRRGRRPSDPRGPGCSASRRRGSAAARCERSGWGRTRSSATLAGTPSLLRRKSITRYRCLCPPPWWRVVMRPLALRPAFLGFGLGQRLERLVGGDVGEVRHAHVATPRGRVGLYLRIGHRVTMAPGRRCRSRRPRRG